MDAAFLASVRGWKHWQEAARDPERAAAAVWATIQPLLHQGEFWPERVDRDAPLAAYPITTYADYAETLERGLPLKHSLLTGEELVYWIQSSGSTGEPKSFPGTATFRDQMLRGLQTPLPVLQALIRERKGPGRHVAFTPPAATERSPAGVQMGYGTPLHYPNDGSIFPDAVNSDAEGVSRWRPIYCAVRDIGSIFMVTSEPAHHVLARLNDDRSFYLGLLDGSIDWPAELPPLEIDPGRLEYLRRLLTSREPFALDALWPSLRLLHTWRAGPAGLQVAQLVADCDRDLRVIDLPYNASEGPIANPVHPDTIGGPVHPGAVIHEFIEPGSTDPAGILKPWELEPGRSYEVLLTTAMGLVRYRVGDVVRCTGYFERAPQIVYERRAGAELSIWGGAKFSEDALIDILSGLDLPRGTQCAFGPSADGRAVVLYADRPLPDERVAQLRAALSRANSVYEDLLETGFNAEPRLVDLGRQHPVWAELTPAHDQAKRRYLLHEPPEPAR